MNKIIMLLAMVFIILLIVLLLANNGNNNFLSFINSNLNALKDFSAAHPFKSGLYFFFIYIVLTSFSLPVAFILGLTSGIIFNPLKAITIVSFASSIGATFAFIISRYVFRDYLRKKYSTQYEIMNNGFVKNGIFYLFAIRMSPLFPYFLVNLVSGLTTMKITHYYAITQIGMLPMTIIVALLGRGLDQVILSDAKIEIEFIVLLSLVGLLPLIFNYYFKKMIKN
jgi:uncharacterized membrane protein YdjX (TVP38/TMEM64 family)